jgi:hypothetical protein
MRTLLVSALALGAMTSVALAAEPLKPTTARTGPVELTSAQMDEVTAGQVGVCGVCLNLGIAIAANVLSTGSTAEATTGQQTINVGTGGGG